MIINKKNIVILGAGESGVGAALLAKNKGYDVFVSDKNRIKEKYLKELQTAHIDFEENKHSEAKILNADIIIKSPGIPNDIPLLCSAQKNKIEIISEIDFAARQTASKIIAITGSNGKSTCATLTHFIFKNAGYKVELCGNIGKSFARSVVENQAELFVVEVSSFQLENITSFQPHVAVLLNITPDHLDRYNYSMNDYAAAKFRIAAYQNANDYFIYCADDEGIQQHITSYPLTANTLNFSLIDTTCPAFLHLNQIYIHFKTPMTMLTDQISLKGKHNYFNSMAAALSAKVFDISNEVIRESLIHFQGLEHRLEFIAKIQGIEFINDSKATNVNAAWYALESMTKPVVWIAGGVDKGNDYEALIPVVKQKVKAIVCLGADNLKIHQAFAKHVDLIINTHSAQDAARMALKLAVKNDVVLLSPACASFDLFENYEDRGSQFKQAVLAL